MNRSFISFAALLLISLALNSCVTKKKKSETGAVGKFYHNTTAYYNGYWNANEILKESMKTLRAANVDDYSKVLEVEDYIAIDNPKMVKAEMDKIIEKVTTVAQLHEPSDWVDDCYVMMAKAQYLKQEYETAEETLEYFQEDFNPSNPYGRNYKSKKPTGKAAKKAKEEALKEKRELRDKENEAKAEKRKEEAKAKEDARKEERELKEKEADRKKEAKKAADKAKKEEREAKAKERERLKKEKERQRKEDAKNRKKRGSQKKPATKTNDAPVDVKPEVETVDAENEPEPKVPANINDKDQKVDVVKKDTLIETVKPKEDTPEETYVQPEEPKKPEKDKTAYSEGSLWLAKTYIKRENWFSAEMILQKLDKGAINDDIKSELTATFASLYIKQGKYGEALSKLDQAIEEENDKQLKARYAFIAGQISQQANQPAKARSYFDISQKYARNPKMEFMAELAVAKSGLLSGERSKESVLSDLKGMLGEEKNIDVKDQIYFTIGEIELSQNNFDSALENFRNSVANNKGDQKLKAECYFQVADLLYAKENYLEASFYYDTTLTYLKNTDSKFSKVQRLVSNLREIAANISDINKQDTLLYFASLSDDDRKKIIIPWLERQKVNKPTALSNNLINKNIPEVLTVDFGNSTFFAYNNVSKMKGKEDFEKQWGRRTLEDDWRRSIKISSGVAQNNDVKVAEESGVQEQYDKDEYEKFIRELPTNPLKKQESNDRIMNAMFSLGKLFRDKIDNYSKSSATLDDMHTRFGATPHEQDSYFYQYLNYTDLKNFAKAEEFKKLLLEKYPSSGYANILNNTNGDGKTTKLVDKADTYYQSIYVQFEKGEYTEALTIIDMAPEKMGDTHIYHAKLALLKAMCIGGKDGKDAYLVALNEVVNNYPNTPEQTKAREIARFMGGDQGAFATVKDVDKIYQRDPYSTHYVTVITYNLPEVQHINFKVSVSEYNKKNFKTDRLQMGDALLSIEDNSQIILIRKFENEAKALEYHKRVVADREEFSSNVGQTYDVLVISQTNYRKMLSERSAVAYRSFFETSILSSAPK